MTDNLVQRPVLRIYTEATSGNGGLWAFSPYKSVHTVFVEESNYRDLEDRIEALTARAEAAEAELKAMTAERDRAIDDAKYNAQYVDLVVRYRNERDAMAAENNRLRDALKPFANYAKSLKGWEPTDAVCLETGIDFERVVNAGDFFAARAALKGEQP